MPKRPKRKTRKQKIAESKKYLTCKSERTSNEDIEDLNKMTCPILPVAGSPSGGRLGNNTGYREKTEFTGHRLTEVPLTTNRCQTQYGADPDPKHFGVEDT